MTSTTGRRAILGAIVVVGAELALAGSFLLAGATGSITGVARADVPPPATPSDDSPLFDCRTMGNRICGADNDQNVAPGCYDDVARLVAPLPCYIVVGADGAADVYSGRPRAVDTN